MKQFTYDDYLRYMRLKRYEVNGNSGLREPNAEYKYEEKLAPKNMKMLYNKLEDGKQIW